MNANKFEVIRVREDAVDVCWDDETKPGLTTIPIGHFMQKPLPGDRYKAHVAAGVVWIVKLHRDLSSDLKRLLEQEPLSPEELDEREVD